MITRNLMLIIVGASRVNYSLRSVKQLGGITGTIDATITCRVVEILSPKTNSCIINIASSHRKTTNSCKYPHSLSMLSGNILSIGLCNKTTLAGGMGGGKKLGAESQILHLCIAVSHVFLRVITGLLPVFFLSVLI